MRCHLLIGPPASGKTTLARVLAPLISEPGEPPALVLSTDAIRAEVFGDAAVQGPWSTIQQHLHQRLQAAVTSGIPVIIDATHARRPWRLAITQALELPVPVEWIGWWLFTPLATCLEWNQRRQRLVPEPVIKELAAALADQSFGPSRAEGFAAVVSLVPTHHSELEPVLREELARLERRIRSATNREKQVVRHGYSRLLDLERLLYLLRLLSCFPDLAGNDSATASDLEAIVSPLPEGDLADRAAALLRRLHGDCYGDALALRSDLAWLEQQGFTSALPVNAPIQLPKVGPLLSPGQRSALPTAGGVNGGHPPLGDAQVFIRVFTLLRHVLQQPFDRERGSDLPAHLIAAMENVPGAYLPGEAATLRKDLEKLLTPYGFRARNDNVRHGYALGTALLSAPRLREIHGVVRQAAARLGDPSAQDLLAELEERLHWGGINPTTSAPVRTYANHSVVDAALVRPDSLAADRHGYQQAEAIETAILEHRRVVLERFPSVASFPGSPSGELRVWPLQLIFHNIGWYLLFEEDAVAQLQGLIRTERLDRLALRRSESRNRRGDDVHQQSVERAGRLLHLSGGIYCGDDLSEQLAVTSTSAKARNQHLVTLRFSCQGWAFAFIREGVLRFPIERTRFSQPLAGDTWWCHPKAPHVLEPNPAGDSHPYPVELDLPTWTVQRDVDLRNWLLGFVGGIRIEAPESMREEHQAKARSILAAYGLPHEGSQSGPEKEVEPAVTYFPNRFRRD
ncbi:WYL domain-containing protein [Synechococcus sp. CS-1326]|uniref:WYL domain-containing protein n=1 Tax=Synechococcus sp. CS-1326 TaxID=2847978 RepID=UPI00223B3F04|nr:WYL domain-containing protein [Synechococcus sp. CS-1326]MCT0214370.1 WYL domain-containing protein [Synechococcus sp. CS-1326]